MNIDYIYSLFFLFWHNPLFSLMDKDNYNIDTFSLFEKKTGKKTMRVISAMLKKNGGGGILEETKCNLIYKNIV